MGVKVTRELRRSFSVELIPQECEITDLPLGQFVAGVPAELHLDAEAADGGAGNRSFSRQLRGAGHFLSLGLRGLERR
jgi:hypothetical protein